MVVDAHSKWLEVVEARPTSESTILRLQAMFATHGLPEIVVSDNGPAFVSGVFEDFLTQNGIRHIKTSPYHPASNGLAERAVQTFKLAMKKSSSSISSSLTKFLFRYRITPHPTTGRTPSEMLMGRRLRSRLSLILPNAAPKVHRAQESQKKNHDSGCRLRTFNLADPVFVKNFGKTPSPLWLSGIISEKTGPLSYRITLDDNRVIQRHVDHIRSKTNTQTEPSDFDNISIPMSTPSPAPISPPQSPPAPRRSTRAQKPFIRYSPTWGGKM